MLLLACSTSQSILASSGGIVRSEYQIQASLWLYKAGHEKAEVKYIEFEIGGDGRHRVQTDKKGL